MSTKGTSQAGPATQPTPVTCVTRLSNKNTANTPMSGKTKGQTNSSNKSKLELAGEQARKLLANIGCLQAEEAIMPISLYKIFWKVMDKYGKSLHEDVLLTLQAFALLVQENTDREYLSNKAINAVVSQIEESMGLAIENSLSKLSMTVDNLLANQGELQASSTTLSKTAESLQKLSTDIESHVKEASATSSQLASMATDYRDALLKNGEQQQLQTQQQMHSQEGTTQVDPKVLRDIERKSKQILVDTADEKISNASLAEIKEKVNAAINWITNPPPPKDSKVLEVTKLQKGGFTVLFKEKETTD